MLIRESASTQDLSLTAEEIKDGSGKTASVNSKIQRLKKQKEDLENNGFVTYYFLNYLNSLINIRLLFHFTQCIY